MQGFIQRASGNAVLQVVPGSKHCAITEPNIDINWTIVIEFDSKALDADGFLVDSLAFKAYFTALGSTPISLSCERLAHKIGMDFMAMLGNRKDTVKSIRVTLEPFVGVGVEYCARREKGKKKGKK